MQSTVIILYLPFYYLDCVRLDPSYAVRMGPGSFKKVLCWVQGLTRPTCGQAFLSRTCVGSSPANTRTEDKRGSGLNNAIWKS